MPAGRPKKHFKVRYLTICCDDKDVDYLDDHRGKLSRGDYLIEGIYEKKGDFSRYEQVCKNLDEAKREIQELKRQLLFEQSKNQKTISINPDLEEIRNEYYFKDKTNFDRGIKEGWMNWNKIYMDHPQFKFKNRKEMQLYYTELSEQNNGQINHNSPNVTAGEVMT